MSSFPKRWKNWNSCRWNSSGSFHAARNLPKQNGQIPKKVLCLICLIRTQTEMCQSGHRFEWRGWKHVSRLLSQSTHSWKMKPQICTDKTQQSFNLSYSPPASRLRLRRQNIHLIYLTSDTLAPFKSELLYILSRPQFIRKKNKNKLTSFNSISDMNLKKPNSFRGGERLEMCRGGIPLRADSWCVATLPVGSPTRPEIRTSVEALIVLKAPQCNGGFLVFCYSILNYWHDLCMLLLCDTTLSLEEMLSAVDLPPGGGGRERLYEFKSWICKEEEIVLWFLFCFSGRTPWCDAGMRSSLCFCSNTHVTFLFLSHRFGRMLYLFMSRDALCQCPTPFLQSTTFVLTQKNSAWWVFLFLDFFFFFFFK